MGNADSQGTDAFELMGAEIRVRAQRVDRPQGRFADVQIEFGPDSCLCGLRLVGFAVWMNPTSKHLSVTFPSSYRRRRRRALLKPSRQGADLDLRTAIIGTVAAMGNARHIECVWQKRAGARGRLDRVTIH